MIKNIYPLTLHFVCILVLWFTSVSGSILIEEHVYEIPCSNIYDGKLLLLAAGTIIFLYRKITRVKAYSIILIKGENLLIFLKTKDKFHREVCHQVVVS
jgi:hypothetical protein